jgi:hypothetical protein
VPRKPCDRAFEARVRKSLKRRLGESIAVRLHLVDQMKDDPSGKHRCVVAEAT